MLIYQIPNRKWLFLFYSFKIPKSTRTSSFLIVYHPYPNSINLHPRWSSRYTEICSQKDNEAPFVGCIDCLLYGENTCFLSHIKKQSPGVDECILPPNRSNRQSVWRSPKNLESKFKFCMDTGQGECSFVYYILIFGWTYGWDSNRWV